MTLVIPQDFASVLHSLVWAGDPEPMAITYAVGIDTGAPPASPGALALALATAAGAMMNGLFINDISIVNTEVVWQDAAPPTPPVLGSDALITTGTRTGDALPQNNAFLIHKRTATGGRGGRGRLYAPGVQESVVDNLGNLTGGEITSWNTDLATWLSDVNAISGVTTMVLLHDSNGAYAADPPVPITSLTCDPVIATQRRRLRR